MMNQKYTTKHNSVSIYLLPYHTKMFSPSHLKTLYPLQSFSVKPSSTTPSTSTLSSMKLKRIVHTLIVSHLCRIIRALSKVKAVVVEILKDNSTISFPHKKHYNRRKKIIIGSFRLHYNWCSSKSSHVLPVPEPVYEGLNATCRDSGELQDDEDCPYLRWLEEKKVEEGFSKKGACENNENENCEMNEIDVLAEMFIANCHEKFRLEKQESDRRFHEMLARSIFLHLESDLKNLIIIFDKKVEALEKEIAESREKIEFCRAKMQELVLYKSRCDNRLNEVIERISADKHEVEILAKKYEDKYKQVGDLSSKLTTEEATFRDIQEKKIELYQAIVKMEQDGKDRNPSTVNTFDA